ncbi:hypothetical protein ACFQ5X_41065 [Streptomyces kaempferi]|uniref:Uncharacterized protein n=1 Tax=Streptomyces kaempferi TaxID=333725 RepID=A0ABW3XRH5_9ACTN
MKVATQLHVRLVDTSVDTSPAFDAALHEPHNLRPTKAVDAWEYDAWTR